MLVFQCHKMPFYLVFQPNSIIHNFYFCVKSYRGVGLHAQIDTLIGIE
jgi:hypothetical protein